MDSFVSFSCFLMRDFPFLGKNAENKEKKKEIKLSDFNFQISPLLFHRSTFIGSIQCQVCLAFTMHSTFKGSPPTRAISLPLLLPWDQLFTTMNLLRIDIILLFEAVRINYGQTIILPPFLSLLFDSSSYRANKLAKIPPIVERWRCGSKYRTNNN